MNIFHLESGEQNLSESKHWRLQCPTISHLTLGSPGVSASPGQKYTIFRCFLRLTSPSWKWNPTMYPFQQQDERETYALARQHAVFRLQEGLMDIQILQTDFFKTRQCSLHILDKCYMHRSITFFPSGKYGQLSPEHPHGWWMLRPFPALAEDPERDKTRQPETAGRWSLEMTSWHTMTIPFYCLVPLQKFMTT